MKQTYIYCIVDKDGIVIQSYTNFDRATKVFNTYKDEGVRIEKVLLTIG